MKAPDKGKTRVYDISDTKFAAVKLEESGQFWVTIVNRENASSTAESPFTDNSNVIFLNTIEELREHLFDNAEGDYKDQFKE